MLCCISVLIQYILPCASLLDDDFSISLSLLNLAGNDVEKDDDDDDILWFTAVEQDVVLRSQHIGWLRPLLLKNRRNQQLLKLLTTNLDIANVYKFKLMIKCWAMTLLFRHFCFAVMRNYSAALNLLWHFVPEWLPHFHKQADFRKCSFVKGQETTLRKRTNYNYRLRTINLLKPVKEIINCYTISIIYILRLLFPQLPFCSKLIISFAASRIFYVAW